MALARARFWLIVNIYAILLDVIGLVMFAAALLLLRTWFVTAVLCFFLAVVMLYGGFGVHSTYPEKRRIYSILIRKNRDGVKMESFKDFLSVPCHRVVVRMVLYHLHQSAMYSAIKKKYYVPPWQREFSTKTTYHVFKTKEEGLEWLLQKKKEVA